jgi:hypothetical protein
MILNPQPTLRVGGTMPLLAKSRWAIANFYTPSLWLYGDNQTLAQYLQRTALFIGSLLVVCHQAYMIGLHNLLQKWQEQPRRASASSRQYYRR